MKIIKIFVIFIIKVYQRFISPLKPPTCRFYPSCSEYARQAFEKYGVIKAFTLTFFRLMKCHPFHSGGHDPLP